MDGIACFILVISALVPLCVAQSQTITVCETTGPGKITCPAGKEIQVTGILYGRTLALPVATCNPYRVSVTNFKCIGGAQATNYVNKQCNGKSTCTVVNTYTILGDPCAGVPKFLKIDYQCVVPTPAPSGTVTPTVALTTTTKATTTTAAPTTTTLAPPARTVKLTTLSANTNQTTICETKSATFTCPTGKALLITHVLWGRLPPSPSTLCNPFNSNVTGANCRGGVAATKYVENLCNGKSSCVVFNDWTKLGPDPCQNVPKYLQVSYRCDLVTTSTKVQTRTTTPTPPTTTPSTTTPSTTSTQPPTTSTVQAITTTQRVTVKTTQPVTTALPNGTLSALVCPPQIQTIRCSPGYEIFVTFVFYGRTNTVPCNTNNTQFTNLNCRGTSISDNTVHTYCDHQSSCRLKDNPSWLGEDPCPGVAKYLQVRYTCKSLVPPTTATTPTTTQTSTTTPTPTTPTSTSTSTTTTTPTTTSTTTTPSTTSTTTTPTTTTTTTPTTTSTTTTTPTTTTSTTTTTTTPTTTSTTTTTTTPTTTSTTTTTPTTTTTTPTTTSTTPTTTTTTRSTPTTRTTITTLPPTTMSTFPPYIPFQAPSNAPSGSQVCHEYLVSGPHGVPDSHLTASSTWNSHLPNDNNGPERSRLFTPAYDYGNGTFYRGAWSAGTNDKNQYIQVEFMRPSLVRGVVTQGRHLDPLTLCCVQRTTEYLVSWSIDGQAWTMVKDQNGKDKLFKGNSDDDSLVTHMLDCPFIARFLRLHPQDWQNHVALRFDAIGCQAITADLGKCDPGWVKLPGSTSCYLFATGSKNKMTFDDAERSCTLGQGHLVYINSVKERDFILQEMGKQPSVSMWWIGLSNKPRTDTQFYKWLDGSNPNPAVLQWRQGQPDNSGYGEHCVEFWGKTLNDDGCSMPRNYICEKDMYWKSPVNQPTIQIKTPPTAPPTTTLSTMSTPSTKKVTFKPPPTIFIPKPTPSGAQYLSTNQHIFYTGCVSSFADCRNRPEGDYQSCRGCSHYSTCAVSGYWDRPCPKNLKWDDNTKTCEFRTSTCHGP